MKALLYVSFMFSSLVFADQLTIGWEEYAPYQFKKDQKIGGLDIEVAQLLATKSNHMLVPQEMPWAQHLNQIKGGSIALGMCASKTPERESFANFVGPYRSEKISLFVKKGDLKKFTLKNVSDFVSTKFRLGVLREYAYSDALDALIKDKANKQIFDEVRESKQNYDKLLIDRIDGFLAEPVVAYSEFKKFGYEGKFEEYPIVITSSDIYIMISKTIKDSDKITKDIQSAFDASKKDGTLRSIIDSYNK